MSAVPSPVAFVEGMRRICGMEFTVKSMDGPFHQLKPKERTEQLNHYIIVPWMLEKIEDEKTDKNTETVYVLSDSDLSDFLFYR